MIDITLIPHDLKKISEKVGNWTILIENVLKSGIVIDLSKIIPEGETSRESIISLCELAIKGCNALNSISDNEGVKSRLQRLGSDIVKLQHASNKHSISYYITIFEVVFNDVFGK